MSRTYSHGRVKRYWKDYWKLRRVGYSNAPYTTPEDDIPEWARHWMTTPMWWWRETCSRPLRINSRLACKKILRLTEEELESFVFPIPKQYTDYYW